MIDRLGKMEQRYQEIERLLATPEVGSDLKQLHSLAKERSTIESPVNKYRDYKATTKLLEETRAMLGDSLDEEMKALVKQEVVILEARLAQKQQELRLALLSRDPNDEKDIIVEIRAGTGGEEAALFASELFRMYSRYAQTRSWAVDIITTSEAGGTGGFKEAVFEIRGKGAYSRLKYERGVHRVQRVPVTESSGRIHTSTVTVAVLPKAEEFDISINPDDIKMQFYHSSSAGGQNVNKVATAVRITHLPSGLVVACQDERSQLQNRLRCMSVLRSRLLDAERTRREEAIASDRRSQVGTGERSEKIRTYNFPQDRLTDHRVAGLTLHNLPRIMEGDLDKLIDALVANEQAKQLEEQPA
ncbi:MAG: peptide chain release factor 1 [Dehalococcoidales bacterium]|nr:peptide chain release factor 1 [Dehalococcoidales bacterium]